MISFCLPYHSSMSFTRSFYASVSFYAHLHIKKAFFVNRQKALFERCVPLTRNVMSPSDVMRASRVMFGFAK